MTEELCFICQLPAEIPNYACSSCRSMPDEMFNRIYNGITEELKIVRENADSVDDVRQSAEIVAHLVVEGSQRHFRETRQSCD